MTDEQIKQNAEEYASKLVERDYHEDIWLDLYDAFMSGAHSRDEEIEQLRNTWISVKNRLPEVGDFVLVHTNYNFTFCATRNYCDAMSGAGFVVPIGRIDYWMPIPELPKGE